MKSYNHLWEKLISDENIILAIHNASHGNMKRRKIALKAMRKARRIAKKKRATVHDARQMLTYIGWSKCTDTYNWLKKYVLQCVSFRRLRKIVSKYDKERMVINLARNI